MDKLILMVIISGILAVPALSESSSNESVVKKYLESRNIKCDNVKDIKKVKYGNIEAYNLICEKGNQTDVFEFVPEQLVKIFHIEN